MTVPASDFILEVEGGVTITLQDRLLPYRPVKIGGKQRAEFTWYPGQPDAVVQMLGPEEGVIQLQGWWKDRFFPAEASGLLAGGDAIVANVADLVSLIDDLRRQGRRMRMSWSGLVRYGFITSFQQTWHNPHDCEWEIEFSVSSQNGTTGVDPGAQAPAVADVAAQAQEQANKTAEVRTKVEVDEGGADPSPTFLGLMDSFYNVTVGTANGILNTAYSYAQQALAYPQAVRRTIGGLTGAISGTATTAGAISDAAISELYSFKFWGDQDSAPYGVQLASNNLRTTFARQAREARYSFAYLRQQQAREAANARDNVQIYTATADMDLRDVSLLYYKTSTYWRQLMTYNNMTTSKLTAGAVVYVPQASVFSPLQGGV